MTSRRRWSGRVLRALGRLVPRDEREEWVREWAAELDHPGSGSDGGGRRASVLRLAARLAAAAEDGLRLRLRRLQRAGIASGPGVRDLRIAARTLLRSPLFTGTVVVSLGLGIGANTALFTVVDAVLLEPLPYPRADRLVRLLEVEDEGQVIEWISTPDFDDLAERSRSIEEASLRVAWGPTWQADRPVRLEGASVTSGFFRLFGTDPWLGRYFGPEEDRRGGGPAVVLSYGLWQRLFGADPGLVGRTLTLDGDPYLVVGVAEPGFEDPAGPTEIWSSRPAWIDLATRAQQWLAVFGRVAPRATLEDARAELATLSRELAREHPDTNAGRTFTLASLRDRMADPVRPALLVLLGAVGLVLLITCANVANLLLVRAAGRQREMAVRISLGAGRARLAGQLLAEGLLLAFLGSAAGLAVAVATTRVLVAMGSPGLPRLAELHVDGTVLAFTLLLAGATGIVFGLVPLLQASGGDPARSLGEGGRGGEGRRVRRVRRGLVVAELAVSAVLLVGAGLLVRSLVRLTRVDTGIRPDGVLTLQVIPPEAAFPTPADLRTFYDGVRSGVARLAGVEAVGGSSLLPFTAASWYGFQREDGSATGPEEQPMAVVAAVEPGYFRSLGIPLKEGRLLTEVDGADRPPSLLVDEALVRRYFPGQDPVGRRITVHWGAGLPEPSYEVVGVVGEVRQEGPASLPRPTVYVPRAHDGTPPWMNRTLWITVRTEGDPLALARDVSDVVWGLDRTVPVTDVSPLSDVLDRRRSGHRYRALLVGFFALLATVLATVGIGGVVAYAVAQRGHEIGIRRALGAEAGDVVRLSLAEGARLVGIGVPVGLLLAALASRALRSLLFGVEAGDVPTYVGVGLGLAAVALAAAWIPARRAAEVPPAAALRDGT